MPKTLKCGKQDWYEAFGLSLKTQDSNAVIYEDAGDDEDAAHMTLYRATWKYTFQPFHGVAEIMDRIFGSGPRAAHVTLEGAGDQKDKRAFRGGPSYGDAVQVAKLEGFLKARLDFAADRITQLCTDYDRFDWDLGEHELDKLTAKPGDGFLQIAMITSKKNDIEVKYAVQGDAALMMKAIAIHPLQPLQNTFQRLVRDACRDEKDEEKRKELESQQMANYFLVDSVPPKILAPPLDAEPDTLEQLENAERQLNALQKVMDKAEEGDPESRREQKTRAKEIFNGLAKVRTLYANGDVAVSCLDQVDRALAGLDGEITHMAPFASYNAIHKKLSQAHRELSTAHQSFCCIQNFFIIEPFYLFRLLVKFSVHSDKELQAPKIRAVSALLTELLHNNGADSKWVFDFLKDKLAQLELLLKANCGDENVTFFLKGGRAAKYLLNLGEKGENDWDTSIVINPNLRAAQWYKMFAIVHNTCLVFLQQARAEFLTVVAKNEASLEKGLAKFFDAIADEEAKKKQDEQLADANQDVDHDDEDLDFAMAGFAELFDDGNTPLPEEFKKNTKAELIDIGIPRRDTPEAFEMWGHVRPYLILRDGIPIPGHIYYINEYVMMIRDAFTGESLSMDKTAKRVIRLMEVLVLPDLDGPVQHEKDKIPAELLPKSLKAVNELAKKPIKHLLTIMLKQYMGAWDLKIDTGLAKNFDEMFSSNIGDMKGKAEYAQSLTEAIEAYKKKTEKPGTPEEFKYKAEHTELCDAIGFAQWIAKNFSKHLEEDRHKFNTSKENNQKWGSFMKAFYTGSFFGKNEELEIRMAVTGAAAGLMHANYGKFDRKEALSPVTRLDITIYCKPDADEATVLEMVQPIVETYLKHPKTPKFKIGDPKDVGTKQLCLYWPEDAQIGAWTYSPLAIKIGVVKRPEDWPQLAFIRGMPVLSLRDLVWEFKRLTGDTDENYTHRRRKEATDALVDLLTRFENPDAGDPWVRPGFAGPDVPKQAPAEEKKDDDDKPAPDTSAKVKDGYGEFIVFVTDEDELQSPMFTDYEDAVTGPVYDCSAFGYLATNPSPGDVAGFAAGRVDKIQGDLGNTDPPMSCAFIPRTLYELFFLNRFMAQELTRDKFVEWPIRPMREYQAAIVDPTVIQEAENVWLGYRLNLLFVAALKRIGYDGSADISEKQIETLFTDEIKTFRKQVGECSSDDKIKSTYKDAGSLGRKVYGWFNAELDGFEALMRKAVKAECDSTGKVMLYRGSAHAQDRIDDQGSGGFPISYGTGLWAGIVYDNDGVTLSPLFMLQPANFAYCIQIPWEDLLKAEFPFHIPRTNALKQLFGKDQFFHAWSKAGANALAGQDILPGSHLPYLAYPGGLNLQANYGPYIAGKKLLK